MSITEAAKTLGVSRQTVYRMIEDGRLLAERRRYVKSRKFRVVRESLDALQRETTSEPQ